MASASCVLSLGYEKEAQRSDPLCGPGSLISSLCLGFLTCQRANENPDLEVSRVTCPVPTTSSLLVLLIRFGARCPALGSKGTEKQKRLVTD